MKLVLNNITHRDCPVELREQVSFSDGQMRLMLSKMHGQPAISEAVILETCNRVEFYIYAKDRFDCGRFLAELIGQIRPGAVDTWSKYRREKGGIEAVRHLFEVASGLDSQMVGENQILSQVKSAYTMSVDCQMNKFVFHRLFHNAFRVGKAVRTETDINCGAVSLGLAAVELARRKIKISAGTVMVIGAGENAELVAHYLLKGKAERLIIANRNKVKGKALAARLKAGQVIGLADIAKQLAEVDLLISSTAAIEPVVSYQMAADVLTKRKRPLVIIDLAVPRDVEPQIEQFDCVRLYNIDDLNEQINNNKAKRRSEIPKAEQIVAEFADNFARWYESLNLVPVISQLTKKGIELAESEAARYAKDFGKDNSDKLRLFAESLVKKVLHGPISFLKAGGNEELSNEQLEGIELISKMFLRQSENDR